MRVAGALLLLLGGCGAPKSYMGIDLRPAGDGPRPPVQRLAGLAAAGDKAAQLLLGQLFESGRGVPEDLDRACRLYESAGRTTGGTIYVYQPKIGNTPGRVVPVTTPLSPGLPAARERLTALAYRASGAAGATGCLARHR